MNNIDEKVFYSSSGVPDDDVTAANIGDTCVDGYCTPVRKSLDFDPSDPAKDRWDDATLAVWTTDSRHIKVSAGVTDSLKLAQQPKYIIEFMRYVPPYTVTGIMDKSNCDTDTTDGPSADDSYLHDGATIMGDGWQNWPYCKIDNKEYRITAMGFAGNNNESRVMLQSIYVSD